MNKSDFIWGLEISDMLTMSLVSQMVVFASVLALICFICNMAYNYLYHGASQFLNPDENKFPDFMEIARCLVLFFCLAVYSPIVKTIVGTMEVINKATSLTGNTSQEFEQYLEDNFQKQQKMLDEKDKLALEKEIEEATEFAQAAQKEINEKMDDSTDKNLLHNVAKIARMLSPSNLVASVIHGAFSLLALVAQVVVCGMTVVIVKILVILGPFVFAVSMLPVFQKQLSNWFGTLCSAGMVFTVVNILNHIMWQVFKNMWDTSNAYAGAPVISELQAIAIDIVMIGAYLSSFWLSSKIVGRGDAGRIISKTVSTATSIASLALLGAAAAGGGTNVGKAAAAGQSIIGGKDEE